jgi:hypothetical protein
MYLRRAPGSLNAPCSMIGSLIPANSGARWAIVVASYLEDVVVLTGARAIPPTERTGRCSAPSGACSR